MPFPGYGHLVGPESFWLDEKTPVRCARDYELWHRIFVTSQRKKVWQSEAKCTAYINRGRIVADCYWCKKGMFTRPDWGIACCAQCGAKYAPGMVVFPEDVEWALILEALLVRPDPETQNWDNKQNAADLWRENREELHLDQPQRP
jgi:hypothetical protein